MQWDSSQQEEVVTEYVKLGIELDKVKMIREGLLQYRNLCQHTVSQLSPLVRVLTVFRKTAESRLAEAESGLVAEQQIINIIANVVDDGCYEGDMIEVDSTAEVLHLSALSSDCWSDGDRELKVALRLTLEVYRTIMDIIKTTPKLHRTYHETVHKAFDFCRKYGRAADFRRLCEMVRNHYVTIMRQKPKNDMELSLRDDLEDLRQPEIHIETRLSQLKNAAALNLWKEAMQTMEDLYGLGVIELASKRILLKSKSSSSLQLRQLLLMSLAAYYEKLGEVFDRANFRALHALALLKWLGHTRQHNKSFSPTEDQHWSSVSVLAVLSTPIIIRQTHQIGHPKFEEEKRLTTLLGHPHVPNRQSLLGSLKDRGVISMAYPCVQKLFQVIEGNDFLPLSAVNDIQPLLEDIRAAMTECPRIDHYVSLLKEVVFRKLLISLSGVYSTISFEFFKAKICPIMTWIKAERSLVAMADDCQLSLRLDYVSGVIRLSENSHEDPHGLVADRIAKLNSSLIAINAHNKPTNVESLKKELRAELLPNEATAAAARLQLLDKKRTEIEHLQKKRDENLEEQAKKRAKREADSENARQKMLAEEKATAKKREEAEQAKIDFSKQLLTKLTNVVKLVQPDAKTAFLVCGTPIQSITPHMIVDKQITFKDFETALEEFIQKFKAQQIQIKKVEHKKVDHLARALRIEDAKQTNKTTEIRIQRERELLEQINTLKKEGNQSLFKKSP